jgi:hypothetical protein
MQHHLYPADWKERGQAAAQRAGGRCERCGAVLGTMRLSRKHNLYLLPLHTSHVNHDPENPEAELQKLCPSCHGKTHPWLPSKRDDPNRRSYRPITQERVLRAARSGGLAITPHSCGARYTWEIAALSGNASDVLDALSQALHFLRMERLEWVAQQEGCQHG